MTAPARLTSVRRLMCDRRYRQARLLAALPQQYIEYPMECGLVGWGVLSGLLVAIGVVQPNALAALLPQWIVTAWGLALFTGAATVAVGLARKAYSTAVSRGLQLAASACACYAIAIIANIGWGGVPAGGLLLYFGNLMLTRSWWLRTRDDLAHDIEAAAE